MAKLDIADTVSEISEKVVDSVVSGLLMPKCCWTCKHDVTYRWKVGRRIDEDICMLTGKIIKMDDDEPWKRRAGWCPLVLQTEADEHHD